MKRFLSLWFMVFAAPAFAAEPKFIPAQDGTTAAVVVEGVPLIHGWQIYGNDLDAMMKLVPKQYQLVKVNFSVDSLNTAMEAQKFLKARYPKNAPATSYVVGKMPREDMRFGLDFVAITETVEGAGKVLAAHGSRVYVSGQAEKGVTLAEATRNTLASLKKTLDWLGCSLDDVVQCKSFLKPITTVEECAKEFEALFGKGKVPPLVFVEWDSTLPIEIELIANAPKPKEANPPAVEFLTPPGMTASPVFCRVTKVNAPETIYINSLYAAKTERAGPDEVPDVFGQLSEILKKCDSDVQHLAKATYYVSADDVSAKLNQFRPTIYDAKRPPAASKAMVAGVGLKDRSFTMDMIAVKRR